MKYKLKHLELFSEDAELKVVAELLNEGCKIADVYFTPTAPFNTDIQDISINDLVDMLSYFINIENDSPYNTKGTNIIIHLFDELQNTEAYKKSLENYNTEKLEVLKVLEL